MVEHFELYPNEEYEKINMITFWDGFWFGIGGFCGIITLGILAFIVIFTVKVIVIFLENVIRSNPKKTRGKV